MPKSKVLRGFTYTPKGKTVDRRVEAGADVPADLTATQVARLAERGIVEKRQAPRRATRSKSNG